MVATIGTTSTTAIDPVPAIADICARENIWLHVDAAYGGSAAILPEMRWLMQGAERAHSLVVNPHKWLFVPLDCSVLFCSRPDLLRAAFSLTPEYLLTAEREVARNLMDYGVSLGRRFRALKLWFVLRYYGTDFIAERIRGHIALAQWLATAVRADPDFELLAEPRFSVVVFRYRPHTVSDEHALERLNQQILDAVNQSGEIFLSHTRVAGHFALRIAVGNLRTEKRHVERAWELIRRAVGL